MDTINDNLSLTVINDGDGSQCGYSYKERLTVFENSASNFERHKAIHALRMVNTADDWMRSRNYEGANAAELLDQAAKVAEYYAEHVTQLVRSA